jgi:hypothetical protein
MNKNKKFKLNLEDNYNKVSEYKLEDIMYKFILLTKNYIIHSYENSIHKHNSIYISGLDMITNIYRLLFLYTKNLELTIYHTNSAIYYYIEYMSQITDSDDNIFFNLTMKDAVMYVYNKTVFDINKKYSKITNNSDETTIFLEKLNIITYIIKKIDFSKMSIPIDKYIEPFIKNIIKIVKYDINILNIIEKDLVTLNNIEINDDLFINYLEI